MAGTALALSFGEGAFHVVSGACNHAGGPLGEGRLDGDYIRNLEFVRESRELREGAAALAGRTVDLARRLLDSGVAPEHVSRGGRKAHHMGAA